MHTCIANLLVGYTLTFNEAKNETARLSKHSNPPKKSRWENDSDFACNRSLAFVLFCIRITHRADKQTHVHPRGRPAHIRTHMRKLAPSQRTPTNQPTNAKPHNIVNFESLSYVLCYLTGLGWRFSCWHQLDGHYVIRAPIEVGWIMSAVRERAHNRKHRHDVRSFISHILIYAMQRMCAVNTWMPVVFVGSGKKKRTRGIRISQFDECESSTKWTMNKNRICHSFSFLLFSFHHVQQMSVVSFVQCFVLISG